MIWSAVIVIAALLTSHGGTPLFPVEPAPESRESLAHPAVALVDTLGEPAVRSGRPVSTMKTCGACHDTEYIATNSYHASVGAPDRHAGGSDGAEFNCFLCHLPAPDNTARIDELRSGNAPWAATATLARTGLVHRSGGRWVLETSRFDAAGRPVEPLGVAPPSNRNCGQCHGLVHGGDDPVNPSWRGNDDVTEWTGQIVSAQRIVESAMNVAGKDTLTRPWDVHTERLLDCTSCHFSLNDPAYAQPDDGRRPSHLEFDSRRQNISEFLRRPSHQFARGSSDLAGEAAPYAGTMRRCEDCHDAGGTHDWLPYAERHFARVMCESCHIPSIHAPARRAVDRTVVMRSGAPRVEYRGIDGPPGDPAVLIDGYRPHLAPRLVDGELARLGPVNVIASWTWVSNGAPVDDDVLARAFLINGDYHPDIVAAFDRDGDGALDDEEVVIDTDARRAAVRERLEALGVASPQIKGRLETRGIHHTVAGGKWATRDCSVCHAESSALSTPVTLASVAPGGVIPTAAGQSVVSMAGTITLAADGSVEYTPGPGEEGFYVLGHDRWGAGDAAGIAILVAVVLGVLVHGGLRYRFARTDGRTQ